jgi:hypothetical protein
VNVAFLGLTPGQDESEGRAAAGRGLDVRPTTMELDEGFDQAKTQPDAALAVLIVARGVMERIEPCEEGLE